MPVVVPLPPSVDPAELGATQHKVRTVEVPDVAALLDAAGLRVTTMGRGPDQEPRFFAACAAAGVVAAGLLGSDTDCPRLRIRLARPSESTTAVASDRVHVTDRAAAQLDQPVHRGRPAGHGRTGPPAGARLPRGPRQLPAPVRAGQGRAPGHGPAARDGRAADDYPPVFGYRIPRERAHLRDPGLDPEELAALALAASAVRLDGIEGSGGLWKLGGEQAGAGRARASPGCRPATSWSSLFEAVTERRQATFAYRDLDRTVDPWRLGCTRGRWYLTGHDHTRGDTRHFRVDRIGADLTTGPPGAFTRPTGAIEGVRMEAWRFGPGPARTRPAARRRRPRRHRPSAPHPAPSWSRSGPTARPCSSCEVTDVGAVPLVRPRVPRARRGARTARPARRGRRLAAEHRRGRGGAVRLSTAEKLQRLISIVAWINGQEDGATLDEVCTRFDISRGELVAQLEMANMIGAESEEFTDMPVEVTFEGDVVRVFLMEFHRPLSLTPAQGLALVAAGAGSAALPGADPDGPLPRALAKLAGVLGIDPSETIDVDLGDADPAVLDELRRAVESHEAGRGRLLVGRPRRPDPPGRRPVAGVQRRGRLVRPGPLPPGRRRAGLPGGPHPGAHRPRRDLRPAPPSCPTRSPTGPGPRTRGSCSSSARRSAGWPTTYPVDAIEELGGGTAPGDDAGRRAGLPRPPAPAARARRTRGRDRRAIRRARRRRPTQPGGCSPATSADGRSGGGGDRR